MEGWVSVACADGNTLIQPAAVHAPKAMPGPPPAKRGRETHLVMDENNPDQRRRRFWY